MSLQTRIPFDDLPPAQQAGILCNEEPFRRFAAQCCGLTSHVFGPSATAQWIRVECGIHSRRDLNSDPLANDKFQRLRTNYDAWRGKLATPR